MSCVLRSASVFRLLLLLAMCSMAPIASAQSTATAGAEVDVVSRYVWRGVPYSDGAAVQPSIWASVDALTFSFWSNLVVADRIDRGRFNHLFVMATYSHDVGRFTIEPSVQAYHTRAVGDVAAVTTAEGVLRVSAAAGAFELFTDHSVDLHAYRGGYIGDVGLGHEQPIGARYRLTTEFLVSWSNAAYNSGFVGVATSGLNYAALNGRVAIRLDDRWSLRPHVEWQPILDTNLRRALGSNMFFSAGVALSAAFD